MSDVMVTTMNDLPGYRIAEVGDAEDEDVVEPVTRLRVDRVGPPAAVEAEELAVHRVRRAPVLGHLLRRQRHREG